MTNSENSQGRGLNQEQPQQPAPDRQAVPSAHDQGIRIPDPQQFMQHPAYPSGHPVQPRGEHVQPGTQQAPAPQMQAPQAQVPQTIAQMPQPGAEQMAPQARPEQYAEYVPSQGAQYASSPAPGMEPYQQETFYAPQAEVPVDDYQYPQGQSILPEVPSVAIPPAAATPTADQAIPAPVAPQTPQQVDSHEYGDSGDLQGTNEQISQRLAQLQSQYDQEMAAANPTIPQGLPPEAHQGTFPSSEPLGGYQPSFEEPQAPTYPPASQEGYQPQTQQQAHAPQLHPQSEQQPPYAYPEQHQALNEAPIAAPQDNFAAQGEFDGLVHETPGQLDAMDMVHPSIAQEMPQGDGFLKKATLGGAFVVALAIGGGAAYTYQYTDLFGRESSSAPAPTIKAATTPSKTITRKVGRTDAPNDKAMHKRMSGKDSGTSIAPGNSGTAKLAVQPTGVSDMAGNKVAAASTGMMPKRTMGTIPAAPRRVKTLIVRPDGTIMQPAVADAAANAAVAPGIDVTAIPKASASNTNKMAVSGGNKIRRMKTIEQASSARLLTGQPERPLTKSASRTQIQPVTRKPKVVRAVKVKAPAGNPLKTAARPSATTGDVGLPFVVQVTSRSSQTSALAAFADMQQKYPSLIGAFAPDIQRADLGTKGVWYRLRVGPVGTKSAASDLCTSLKQAGHPGCFVRRK